MKYILSVALGTLVMAGPMLLGDKDSVHSRASYIRDVERQLNEWDVRVSNLKDEKDAEAKTSRRFDRLDNAIIQMENDLSAARQALAALRSTTVKDWSAWRTHLDAEIDAIQAMNDTVRLAE